jgi:hypothetical protein
MRCDADIPIILDPGVFQVTAPVWLDKPRVGDEQRDGNLAVLLVADSAQLSLLVLIVHNIIYNPSSRFV